MTKVTGWEVAQTAARVMDCLRAVAAEEIRGLSHVFPDSADVYASVARAAVQLENAGNGWEDADWRESTAVAAAWIWRHGSKVANARSVRGWLTLSLED